MKGRLEHSLQIENNIKEILVILPQYVTEYYYECGAAAIRTCQNRNNEDLFKK